MKRYMKLSKVGLLTCYLDNYGACLQAFALQNTIEKMGYMCEIIQYTEPMGYYKKGKTKSLIGLVKDSHLYYYFRKTTNKVFSEQVKLVGYRPAAFRHFRSKWLHFSKENYSTYYALLCGKETYDQYVCGSDQIWNPTFYSKCNPAYYLAFVPDSTKKIAYAPSIGLTHMPVEYQGDFRNYVQRLDYISCRESMGCDLIYQCTGRTAEHVLDPTFLLRREEWDKYISKKRENKNGYILCYLFGRNNEYDKMIVKAKEFFNCKVKYIPIFPEDADKKYDLCKDEDPFGFIELI